MQSNAQTCLFTSEHAGPPSPCRQTPGILTDEKCLSESPHLISHVIQLPLDRATNLCYNIIDRMPLGHCVGQNVCIRVPGVGGWVGGGMGY